MTEESCPTCHLRKILLLPKGQVSPSNNERPVNSFRIGGGKLPLTYLSVLFSLLPRQPRLQPWEGNGEIPMKPETKQNPPPQIKGNCNQLKASKYTTRKENEVL